MHIGIVVGNIVNQPVVDALAKSANANLRIGSGVAFAFIVDFAFELLVLVIVKTCAKPSKHTLF